jgi:hypothetical protein
MLCSGWPARVALILVAGGPAAAVFASPAPNPPARLAVSLSAKTAAVGATVEVTIGLRDAYNSPTPAVREYEITVGVFSRKEDPPLVTKKVQLTKGRDSVETSVRMPRAGILIVKASHPALREASAFISVGPKSVARSSPWRAPARVVRVANVNGWRPRQAAWLQDDPPAAPAGEPTLSVHYAHEGTPLSANGKDVDSIDAFLSEPITRPLTLRFWSSSGILQPNPIHIPAGEIYAGSGLTTTHPGVTKIRLEAIQPSRSVALTEGGAAAARFTVPILQVLLTPSPSQVPLGSATDVQVRLLGIDGSPVAPDEEKEVWIAVDRASTLTPNPVRLAAGKVTATARLTPLTTGPFLLSATTHGSATREPARLDVVWPVLTLAAIGIGGLLGGILRAGQTCLSKEAARVKKALVEIVGGPIVAFAVFAACLLGFFPRIGLAVAASPIGAPFIAIVGAYAGAALVGRIARAAFGVPAAQPQGGAQP